MGFGGSSSSGSLSADSDVALNTPANGQILTYVGAGTNKWANKVASVSTIVDGTGATMVQEPKLKFSGATVTDDAANLQTVVTLSVVNDVYLASDWVLSGGTTTLTNVTGMSQAIAANEVWLCKGVLIVDGPNTGGTGGAAGTGDVQLAWTGPSGATVRGRMFSNNASAANTAAGVQTGPVTGWSQPTNYGTFGTGLNNAAAIDVEIRIQNGATAGTMQLQAAQVTSDTSGSLTIRAGSWLTFSRVSP